MRKIKKKKWRVPFKLRAVGWSVGVLVLCASTFFVVPYMGDAMIRASGVCGLLLEDITTEGRLRLPEEALNRVIQKWRNGPMLAFSIREIRDDIQALTWVKNVTVRRIWPFTLHINLEEFEPIATWHNKGKQLWVDRDGVVICPSNSAILQLPVISGEDAPHQIATFLAQVRTYQTLWKHVTAFLHIRKRRWNVMVGHTMLVKLPQDNVDHALKKIDEWLDSGKIHPAQIAMLDMRMNDKYVIQPQAGVPVQVN